MKIVSEDQISGKVVDHLGLIAATIDKLGLINKIDNLIPLSLKKGAKTSMGQRVSAMILMGWVLLINAFTSFHIFFVINL